MHIMLYYDTGEDNYLEKEMDDVIASLESNTPHTDSVEKWGRQCANPGITTGLHADSLTR